MWEIWYRATGDDSIDTILSGHMDGGQGGIPHAGWAAYLKFIFYTCNFLIAWVVKSLFQFTSIFLAMRSLNKCINDHKPTSQHF